MVMRPPVGPLCSALLLLLTKPLAAQSNAERVANDAYSRSHDYDLVHQRIEVRNFDWDSTALDGRVTTTLVALRPGLDSVILDAGKRLAVTRAADSRGTPLRTAAHGDTLVVYPARPIAFHDTLRFVLDYHARITNGRGLTFIQPEGRAHRPQQIWSQGEEHDNHLWFPTYDFPNDKMTWDLVATVPEAYSVVSNGRLVSDRPNADATHTVTWNQDKPNSTYLVSLVIAPLVRLADRWRGIPVDYYVYRADSALARRLFDVTPEDWANMWLNEGFAEFLPGQYWGTTLGPHAAEDYYLDEYPQYLQIDARRRMPLAALGSNNIYPKGALVLRMLLAYLGPERFWASLHLYLTRHALGNATTDDLRQAVLDATGENLDWFWSEWIYGAGHPQFTVAASYDSSAHALTLSVKQTQRDSALTDTTGVRYETARVFKMPVAVRVGTPGGDLVRRVELTSRDQTVAITGLAEPPTMVVFDTGNTILKELAFDQPTAWLATQLRRDSDLWNRAWAIEQLGKHPADSTALAALAWAATSADYFRTRAAAAEGLAQFAALGQPAGALAAELARVTFRADPRYEVRAAALTALVRADSTVRDSALAWGLASASYQDVIQGAAYRIIAHAGDTAAIPQVEARLGSGRFPAHVLAALAARGSAHALDVLAAHLDDPRASVRRFVVEAFRFTLPHQLGVARLKAVADRLTHADTKQAVTAALEALQKAGAEDE